MTLWQEAKLEICDSKVDIQLTYESRAIKRKPLYYSKENNQQYISLSAPDIIMARIILTVDNPHGFKITPEMKSISPSK